MYSEVCSLSFTLIGGREEEVLVSNEVPHCTSVLKIPALVQLALRRTLECKQCEY